MTPEEIEKLQELLKEINTSNSVSSIFIGIFVCCLIAECIYFCIKYQKVKKKLEEYYLTLNEEEKRKLKMYKEIKKL